MNTAASMQTRSDSESRCRSRADVQGRRLTSGRPFEIPPERHRLSAAVAFELPSPNRPNSKAQPSLPLSAHTARLHHSGPGTYFLRCRHLGRAGVWPPTSWESHFCVDVFISEQQTETSPSPWVLKLLLGFSMYRS